MKFEDINTGGGCNGYFTKYQNFTFYITTMSELTLPKKGNTASIGMYDKHFELQLSSDTIKKFDPELMEEYVKNHIDKYKKMDKKIKHKDEIIYLDQF